MGPAVQVAERVEDKEGGRDVSVGLAVALLTGLSLALPVPAVIGSLAGGLISAAAIIAFGMLAGLADDRDSTPRDDRALPDRGSRGFHALSRPERWIVLSPIVATLALTGVGLLWILRAVVLYRTVRGDQGPGHQPTVVTFAVLVLALSWFARAIR